MTGHHRTFVPAAGRDWLLPFYDPLQKLLGADAALQALIEQASLEPGCKVLDIGCGTGSLIALMGRACPGAEVVGIDPDPKALARARRKAERAGVAATFRISDNCFSLTEISSLKAISRSPRTLIAMVSKCC